MKAKQSNRDLGLILILFLSARLMILAAFATDALFTYGDYVHYFNLARLSFFVSPTIIFSRHSPLGGASIRLG